MVGADVLTGAAVGFCVGIVALPRIEQVQPVAKISSASSGIKKNRFICASPFGSFPIVCPGTPQLCMVPMRLTFLQASRKVKREDTAVDTTKTIAVAGIEATLIRKKVKNIRVTIVPPDGEVRVTAPKLCPEFVIRGFLAERADWIRSHREAIRQKHADEPKRFETGEKVPLFGTAYPLYVLENQKKNGVTLDADRITLSLKAGATKERREAVLNEWYRERLRAEIEHLMPLWSARTGLVPSGWIIRNMTSRWGTCNTRSGRITLNLQLVKYPLPCLEYVILHELAHLRFRGHGADFKAFLDACMPSWKSRRKQLNG